MTEQVQLPNFDPVLCAKVVRTGAAACIAWVMIGAAILLFVDPSDSACPDWRIHREGGPDSLWAVFGMFTVLPAIWIGWVACRWKQFSQKIYDKAFASPRSDFLFYKVDTVPFPYDGVFTAVVVSWALFGTTPLWLMLTNCTDLPRYLGH
jgi:hypothetical protein